MSMRGTTLHATDPTLVTNVDAWHAQRDRAVRTAAEDPQWQTKHVEALQVGVALEREVSQRWPGRVRCLHLRAEIGNVVIFFAGDELLRDEVVSLVPQSVALRAHYISLDARGHRRQHSVATALPREHDGLGEHERQFINFLIEQALQRWTPGI